MTATTFQSCTGRPRLWTSPAAFRRFTGGSAASLAIVKPIALKRGNVLRIRNGFGTRIRAAGGVLWVTEENSLEDLTVAAGETVILTHKGVAVVHAHKPARVVIEIPVGVRVPEAIEWASADGEHGRRIVLAPPPAPQPMAIAAGIAAIVRQARAAVAAAIDQWTAWRM